MYAFIKEKEIERIVLEHLINSKKVEENSKELIRHGFEQAISIMLLQIKQHIESHNRFKASEDIYEATNELRDEIEDYVTIDFSNDALAEYEKEVFGDMFKTVNEVLSDFPLYDENPIEYERMLIISTGLLKIKEKLQKILDDVVYRFSLPEELKIDVELVLTNYLSESFLHTYKELEPLIDSIIEELNEFNNRKDLKKYCSFITNIERLLANFINFRFEAPETEDGIDLTGKYIAPIQSFDKKLKDITAICENDRVKDLQVEEISITNVDEVIYKNLSQDKRLKELFEVIEDDKNNTVDRVLVHINGELTKITTAQLNKIKNASNRFELLSLIVLELFEETLQEILHLQSDVEESSIEGKIMKGVEDTLHLKYASLKDKDEDYHMSKKEDFLIYSEGFIAFKNQFEKNCESYLSQAIGGSIDAFLEAQNKFDRLVEQAFSENEDKDLKYIKTEVLFEIKTLEDLIHHSIMKLKESDNKSCHEFADIVDTLYSRIVAQLKRIDILKINPKPHDSFNGKLHEVLVTEKAEDFTKGQIIRSQNSGFVYGKKVLQRASVIVAK